MVIVHLSITDCLLYTYPIAKSRRMKSRGGHGKKGEEAEEKKDEREREIGDTCARGEA